MVRDPRIIDLNETENELPYTESFEAYEESSDTSFETQEDINTSGHVQFRLSKKSSK